MFADVGFLERRDETEFSGGDVTLVPRAEADSARPAVSTVGSQLVQSPAQTNCRKSESTSDDLWQQSARDTPNSYPDNSADLRLNRMYLRPLFRYDRSNTNQVFRNSHYSYYFIRSLAGDANYADSTVLYCFLRIEEATACIWLSGSRILPLSQGEIRNQVQIPLCRHRLR